MTILSSVIQKDPGFIVGPITWFLGIIINAVYNVLDTVMAHNVLGFSIIIVTIITRFLMVPLAVKQQKSMQVMQALTPEVEKIKAKYPDKNDKEAQQKMNQEVQMLYQENKVNPFASCLPIFIQMPIFVALNYLMNNNFRYIDKIGELYSQLASNIMSIPNYIATLEPMTVPMLTKKMAETFSLANTTDVEKVINKLNPAQWSELLATADPNVQITMNELLSQKDNINMFLGINLTQAAGWAFPGVILPVLATVLMVVSSRITAKQQASTQTEEQRKQQNTMMLVMSVFMGWMTSSLMAGVGVYWVTSSAFQLVQQLIMGSMKKDTTSAPIVEESKPKIESKNNQNQKNNQNNKNNKNNKNK